LATLMSISPTFVINFSIIYLSFLCNNYSIGDLLSQAILINIFSLSILPFAFPLLLYNNNIEKER